ncbi:hypothetical protein CEXT_641521 [Caerostris extrusa]|uniref:Uncharacterized protein n=1 Tax=Caerostris extrusa TaxID=172846 RepID=A0AAV4SE74_CAEEX|nr:hypothetical protein CEXT_641521 [Caerostris extrusa]
MVEETAFEVGSQAHTMSESRGKSNFVIQRIMMFLEKGITLTVWRIAPIRRNLIFGYGSLMPLTHKQEQNPLLHCRKSTCPTCHAKELLKAKS